MGAADPRHRRAAVRRPPDRRIPTCRCRTRGSPSAPSCSCPCSRSCRAASCPTARRLSRLLADLAPHRGHRDGRPSRGPPGPPVRAPRRSLRAAGAASHRPGDDTGSPVSHRVGHRRAGPGRAGCSLRRPVAGRPPGGRASPVAPRRRAGRSRDRRRRVAQPRCAGRRGRGRRPARARPSPTTPSARSSATWPATTRSASGHRVVHVAGSVGPRTCSTCAGRAGAGVAACHPAMTVPAGRTRPRTPARRRLGRHRGATPTAPGPHDLVQDLGGDPVDVPECGPGALPRRARPRVERRRRRSAAARQALLGAGIRDPTGFLAPAGRTPASTNVLRDGRAGADRPGRAWRRRHGPRAISRHCDADLPHLAAAYRLLTAAVLAQAVRPSTPRPRTALRSPSSWRHARMRRITTIAGLRRRARGGTRAPGAPSALAPTLGRAARRPPRQRPDRRRRSLTSWSSACSSTRPSSTAPTTWLPTRAPSTPTRRPCAALGDAAPAYVFAPAESEMYPGRRDHGPRRPASPACSRGRRAPDTSTASRPW